MKEEKIIELMMCVHGEVSNKEFAGDLVNALAELSIMQDKYFQLKLSYDADRATMRGILTDVL